MVELGFQASEPAEQVEAVLAESQRDDEHEPGDQNDTGAGGDIVEPEGQRQTEQATAGAEDEGEDDHGRQCVDPVAGGGGRDDHQANSHQRPQRAETGDQVEHDEDHEQ